MYEVRRHQKFLTCHDEEIAAHSMEIRQSSFLDGSRESPMISINGMNLVIGTILSREKQKK